MTPAQIRAALDQAVTIDITTTGRRSGLPRRIEIWMVKVDGDYLITGTPGARDWYANLQANPRLMVHLEDEISIDLPAVAMPILDLVRRRAILGAPQTEWYRSQANLEALVAGSPLVKLVFRDLESGVSAGSGRPRSAR
jgi:deazaflavin-dependent oxidoreductase (nitroreductase family)